MKKALAMLLTLVMLLSCLSVTAFAGSTISEAVVNIGEYTDCNTPVSVTIPDGVSYEFNPLIIYYYICGEDFFTHTNMEGEWYGWGKNGTFIEEVPDVSSASKIFVSLTLMFEDDEITFSDTATLKCNNAEIDNVDITAYTDFSFLTSSGSGSCFGVNSSGNMNIFYLIYPTAPATSGTTDIKAVKAAPLSYKLVIPQNVPTITAAGVTEIGAPSVEDVKNATEKTVISYTASGTNFKLSTDESKTMTATYYSAYTDASTNTVLDSTKAIEVYKNSAVIASPTSLYVGVAETDWNAADAGTYHATVTFNFVAVEESTTPAIDLGEQPTISTLLALAKDSFPTDWDNGWVSEEGYHLYLDEGNGFIAGESDDDCTEIESCSDTSMYNATKASNTTYTYGTMTFNVEGGVLTSIIVADGYSDGTYRPGK